MRMINEVALNICSRWELEGIQFPPDGASNFMDAAVSRIRNHRQQTGMTVVSLGAGKVIVEDCYDIKDALKPLGFQFAGASKRWEKRVIDEADAERTIASVLALKDSAILDDQHLPAEAVARIAGMVD